MLAPGRQDIFHLPSLTLFPGLAIFLAVIDFHPLGDGRRDALDPCMKQV
jgi:ABC-type dipeptide/oligopeptide/nickel transport system permease subunit